MKFGIGSLLLLVAVASLFLAANTIPWRHETQIHVYNGPCYNSSVDTYGWPYQYSVNYLNKKIPETVLVPHPRALKPRTAAIANSMISVIGSAIIFVVTRRVLKWRFTNRQTILGRSG